MTVERENKSIGSEIKVHAYKPLFRVVGRCSMLHGELFLKGSLRRGDPLVLYNKGIWQTFIHAQKEQSCLRKGLQLFSDAHDYLWYAEAFRSHLTYLKEHILPLYCSPLQSVTKRELAALLPLLVQFFEYYGYTEFSYHDLAYEKMHDKQDLILTENLADLGKLKIEGREVLNALIYEGGVLFNLLHALASEYTQGSQDPWYLYSDELLALCGGMIPNQASIEERKQCYSTMQNGGVLFKMQGQDALHLAEQFSKPVYEQNIQGIGVTKGKYLGRALVLPTLSNPNQTRTLAEQMQPGDILIAHSTTPDIMHLCQKAGAIVTDQGGMLSHAAVVARELKIPCIIATQHATLVFKTGEYIEVDTEQGYVKRIHGA